MMILAVFGPWQLIVLLGLVLVVLVLPIYLIVSRAKHKARANTLDSIIHNQSSSNSNQLSQLERLNKLRESGALTDAEFEDQKRKVLG